MPHLMNYSGEHERQPFIMDRDGFEFGPQRPAPRLEHPHNRYEDFLSPAEAAFAYEDERDKENQRPSGQTKPLVTKFDSPLDIIREEHPSQQYAVSPISSGFSAPPSPRKIDGPLPFHARQLSALSEEPVEVVPILVGLKTNVIVKDEFRLVTELSRLLAKLFFCTQEGVVVNIDHSACLMLAASFDPAYMMTVATTSSQIEIESNGLNTARLQLLMHQILKVPSNRGMVRFQEILDENIGFKETTFAHLNHRPSHDLEQPKSPVRLEGLGISQSFNPDAPLPTMAHEVLHQQINSMTEGERRASQKNQTSPDANSSRQEREWQDDVSSKIQKRQPKDGGLNFHRPRPLSVHSTKSSKSAKLDWRPPLPSPTRDDFRAPYRTKSEGASITGSDDGEFGMPPPPPIPQGRAPSDVKVSRRRSLFAVFRK